MPQPPPYNRSFSFSNFQAQNPTAVPPGSSIDLELNNVKANSDGVSANLARIQRDDGALANGSVSFDQLSRPCKQPDWRRLSHGSRAPRIQ